MGYDLTSVFVFTAFSALFVIVAVAVFSRILRPKNRPSDEPAKMETYECGEPAIGSSWVRFDIRFYTVALVFIIFDVEVAFLYPWAVVFEDLRKGILVPGENGEAVRFGLGGFVFLEMLVFLAILAVGFIYCWAKGDLDWVKSTEGNRTARGGRGLPGGAPAPTAASKAEPAGAGRS